MTYGFDTSSPSTAPYAATFHLNGQNFGPINAAPFSTNLGLLPAGSYTSYVHVTDGSAPTAQAADSPTNIFTILANPLTATPSLLDPASPS